VNGAGRNAALVASLVPLLAVCTWQAGRLAAGDGFAPRLYLEALWIGQALCIAVFAPRVPSLAGAGRGIDLALLPAWVPLPFAVLGLLGGGASASQLLAVTGGLCSAALLLAALPRWQPCSGTAALAALQCVAAAAAWAGRGIWLPGSAP
jgi:hypothetical protein